MSNQLGTLPSFATSSRASSPFGPSPADDRSLSLPLSFSRMASHPSPVPSPSRSHQSFLACGMAIIWAIALAKFLFHIYFNNRYGYFRDEFDYISCGDHLAWGYVDQPPLIPFLIHICRAVLGDSLRSIRFIPALASSLLVVQTAVLAREFGGRRFALLLSAITVVIAPQYLSNGSLLATNCLEPNLWMGCAYFAILAIKRDNPRYWLWFGVVAGIGLEEKYSIALFGFGIVVGLLLTAQRRVFLNPWIWIGGARRSSDFSSQPALEHSLHWPFLQLMHNIRAEGRDVILPLPQYFFAADDACPSFHRAHLADRIVRVAFLPAPQALSLPRMVLSRLLHRLVLPSRQELLPRSRLSHAAGCRRSHNRIRNRWKSRRRSPGVAPPHAWLKPVIVIVLLASGVHLVPITVPVLSPDNFLAYTKTLALQAAGHGTRPRPRRTAAVVRRSIRMGRNRRRNRRCVESADSEERRDKTCGIFAQDYGQAGAIDFLGRRYGLPPALSGHQTLVSLGPARLFRQLHDRSRRQPRTSRSNSCSTSNTSADSADNPYALEKQIEVYICRGAKFGTLAQLWPQLKRWR